MNDQVIEKVLNYISAKAEANPSHYGWVELYETTGKSDVEYLLDGVVGWSKIVSKLNSIAQLGSDMHTERNPVWLRDESM
jgi:hypothetical protein